MACTQGLAFVHRPMLVATTPGATLTLAFEGNAIGIAIVSGKDAGIVSYSIDNGPFKEMDLFTQWSKSLAPTPGTCYWAVI